MVVGAMLRDFLINITPDHLGAVAIDSPIFDNNRF